MSKGKKGGKEERNPLEGVTFDQLSEKEKALARLILQDMGMEEEPDKDLSLPDAILKFAEENPDLEFSEKERQLIDTLKSEKSGAEVGSERPKPPVAEELQQGKKNLRHVEPTERPKAPEPTFSELIADKAAEMQAKRNASKVSTVQDDFLKVTENEHDGVDSTVEVTPKSSEKVKADTPESKLAAVLDKAGVELASEDRGIVSEMIHTIGVMDGKSDKVMNKVGSKLEGVGMLVRKYPALESHAEEFCQVFESAASNPNTVKFMQENYLNSVRGEVGSEKSVNSELDVGEDTPKPKATEKTTTEKSSLAITDGSEIQAKNQEPQAKDSIIFSPSSKDSGAKKISTSDAVDPITQAIRDEILKKQQLLLQQEIAKGMEGQEKEDFLAQDLTAIRSYLQTDAGKQAVDDVMKSPELRKQMHAIERDGYKTVHNTFKDSFRDVDWGKINEDKIRTTDVKDADGNPVCTLKETTVDTKPQTITLADGTKQTINKYRKIDFPRELETGNGPMHVSMAVRDANGRPISAKEAVYFTAHYDDSGKLTEVSSPTPVHFAGDGPDAIGYIEVDGKVFTLPVTKGKYQEMMREVAKNNGLETDISQSVVKDQDKEKPLAIEDAPKKPKEKPLAIEDAPKKPKEKPLAIEDAPKKPKERTEAQELAEKMRKSREARGNNAAEPESRGGGKPVNVKTGESGDHEKDSELRRTEAQELAEKMRKSREARGNEAAEPEARGGESEPKKTEAQELAEKMRKSREARGNEAAEPEARGGESEPKKTEAQELAEKMKQSRGERSNEPAEPEARGGGKPVNVKTPKATEKESEPKLNEAQKMAKKMKKSRADRDNVVAESESRGGGKPVNVKAASEPKVKPLKLETPDLAGLPDPSSKDNLLGAAKELAEAVSALTKNVRAAARKGSKVNAMTGKEVSSAVKKLSTHTRSNVDPVLASGSKAKGAGKTRTVAPPNVAQKQSTGHSR